MKRGLIIFFAIIFILVISSVTSQEFSVRFFSFGKNATIDLKLYLGESEHYIASKTENVLVTIDQQKGIARLEAKPGWVGSEVIFFRTIESRPTIKKTTEGVIKVEEEATGWAKRVEGEEGEEKEVESITPLVPKELKEKAVVWGENIRLFGGTVDSSVLEFLESIIKREEIRKLTKKVEANRVEISINDEVDLNFETGYIPKASINFSLTPKIEGATEERIEELEKPSRTSFIIKIIAGVIICLIIIILISNHINRAKRRQVKRKKKRSFFDSTTFKLQTLQRNLGTSGSEEFLTIVRSFFSRYFEISYDFEFEELIKMIEESDADSVVKRRMVVFVKALSKWMIGPDTGQIPERELKRLITTMKNILQNI